LCAAIVALAAYSPATAQGVVDRVRLMRGSESGEITEMTPVAVTLSKGSAGTRELPLNEIRTIVFHEEPSALTQARVNAANGSYRNALEALGKIDARSIRREFIKQDVEYYQAYCAAKLALTGEGEIADAGRQLNAFVRTYPKNFHYLAAVELMGDLLMSAGAYDKAAVQYAELSKAPWADYKMRAAIAVGRSLQAQGKHAEAIREFDAALAMPDQDADAKNQKLAATLAKAVSRAETGGVEEAVGTIEKVIQDTDAQQKELHARAYNALGSCYEKAGQTKDALLAFLHVDVLYNTVPEAHAEALAHLVPLWRAVGQQERSREARELLQQQYPLSRWAKELE
jgi:tetratricopeptide (TPR) repeat protein